MNLVTIGAKFFRHGSAVVPLTSEDVLAASRDGVQVTECLHSLGRDRDCMRLTL